MFTLTNEPLPRKRPPRDRAVLLRLLLDKPTWTPRDRQRAEHIAWKYEETAGYGDNATDDVWPIIREWDRILTAPLPPSTAWLWRQLRIHSRDQRALTLYDTITAKQRARRDLLMVGVKRFKTYDASRRQALKIHGGDAVLQRLAKAEKMLERYVPNLGMLRYQTRVNSRTA